MPNRLTAPSLPTDAPELTEFFYRIDFLNLVAEENQPIGFHLVVSAAALKRLIQTPMVLSKQTSMIEMAREQIVKSGLKSRSAADGNRVVFRGEFACPLYFETRQKGGARLGVDPLTLDRLQMLGSSENEEPEIRYTMVGATAPKQVLAILVMVLEWARHARWALLDLEMPSGPVPLGLG